MRKTLDSIQTLRDSNQISENDASLAMLFISSLYDAVLGTALMATSVNSSYSVHVKEFVEKMAKRNAEAQLEKAVNKATSNIAQFLIQAHCSIEDAQKVQADFLEDLQKLKI